MGNHNTGSAPPAMPDLPPMRVVNLTPHPVVVDGPEGRVQQHRRLLAAVEPGDRHLEQLRPVLGRQLARR